MKGQRKAFLEYFPENYDYDEDDGDGIDEDDGDDDDDDVDGLRERECKVRRKECFHHLQKHFTLNLCCTIFLWVVKYIEGQHRNTNINNNKDHLQKHFTLNNLQFAAVRNYFRKERG